ncbi:CatB-related O-acetyltransferase [Gillisia sp. JM1]|uniref:CatB-related O-acetyltransferase n=1 Tax=Gillisia sp. JM1 TaxID=1283286 RepID=UPI00040268A1|nr:CatB-related O-acetyltransferase [Gillisia sp. JM1]
MRYLKKIIWWIYTKLKYAKKVKFGLSVKIGSNSIFEGMNKLYSNSSFSGKLGYGSYIGPNSEIFGDIGRFCSVAPNVKIVYGKHPFSYPYVSTSPAFYSLMMQNGSTFTDVQRYDEFEYFNKETKTPVSIGNDCWIGEGALILGGIEIGDGAIIMARAVITKNVPSYAIVGGVPAKVKSYRYDPETINYLLKLKWWENSNIWFKKNIELMNDIEKLKKKHPLYEPITKFQI